MENNVPMYLNFHQFAILWSYVIKFQEAGTIEREPLSTLLKRIEELKLRRSIHEDGRK